MRPSTWLPGQDQRAERLAGPTGEPWVKERRSVAVIGGGIAGLAAATALAERGVEVVLLEAEQQLGGRVRSWPVRHGADQVTMSRGFHAFFRQYYNLRSLLRRADPGLTRLRPVDDYPLQSATGQTDRFAQIPRTPPWSLAAFVATSPSFRLRDLGRVDIGHALALLDVDFPRTFGDYDGVSAASFLDRLRFPRRARHLALEVFARSFFADPEDFAAAELVAMFHSYFVGSAEGLLFDVPDDDYDTALWKPLGDYLRRQQVVVQTGTPVSRVDLTADKVRVEWESASAGAGMATVDAIVIATDPRTLPELIGERTLGADPRWRDAVRRVVTAPPFLVWRVWLDQPIAARRPVFLGTTGYGPLDNISAIHRFEAGAAGWAEEHEGAVIELHAYALPDRTGPAEVAELRSQLWTGLRRAYPELSAARIVFDECRLERDCVLVTPDHWAQRPTVATPDPRVVLAGDAVRTDLPVALMERAATTGFQAANTLLAGWGVRGHDLWSVPRTARQVWPGRLRRLLAQPGKLPRRRSR
ncbi:FAD-dependent oxidoreductase [Microlunatus elymi]|uniref:FAD-dependent oxidoreductase n=1 Tax=Microlunatus elymi TaxID=2596828 RepID=A0A516PWV8_9ACTN|nr:FAD-dependent oxidoreductase [Microlunatus elymi]QDP95421.1 FAD-dependent oxidoreductase [Microlunatus elymi]